MPLDPSFRITRTDAGNAELSKPTNGLSIGQRRILAFLDTPQAIGPLLASRDLEPGKFERDLAKLRTLKLVDVPGMPPEPPVTATRPGSRTASTRTPPRASGPGPVTAGSGRPARASPGTTFAGTPPTNGAGTDAAVVLGSGRQALPPRLWILGLALVAVGALAYMTFATSSNDGATVASTVAPTQGTLAPPGPTPPAPAAAAMTAPLALAPAVAPAPPPPLAESVRPVAATVLDGSSATSVDGSRATSAQRKTDLAADVRNDTRIDAHSSTADSKAVPSPPPTAEVAPPRAPLLAVAAPVQPSAPAPMMAVPAVAASAATPTRLATASGPGSTNALAEPTLAQPPVQLAAAAPDAATAHPSAATARPVLNELTPVSREQPDFPREAIAAGVTKGTVKARITVDAAGKVSSVNIIDAQPRRVFDRAVTQALTQWRFNPGAASRSTEVLISFDRD
jgi:TonB family protein